MCKVSICHQRVAYIFCILETGGPHRHRHDPHQGAIALWMCHYCGRYFWTETTCDSIEYNSYGFPNRKWICIEPLLVVCRNVRNRKYVLSGILCWILLNSFHNSLQHAQHHFWIICHLPRSYIVWTTSWHWQALLHSFFGQRKLFIFYQRATRVCYHCTKDAAEGSVR